MKVTPARRSTPGSPGDGDLPGAARPAPSLEFGIHHTAVAVAGPGGATHQEKKP